MEPAPAAAPTPQVMHRNLLERGSREPAPAAESTAQVVRVIGTRVENRLERSSGACTSCSIDGTGSARQRTALYKL